MENGQKRSTELSKWIFLHQKWCKDRENCPCFKIRRNRRMVQKTEGEELKLSLIRSRTSANSLNVNMEINMEVEEEAQTERTENIYLLLRYLMRESLQDQGDNSTIYIFSAYLELFFHKQQRFLALYQITNASQARPSYFQRFLIFSFQ